MQNKPLFPEVVYSIGGASRSAPFGALAVLEIFAVCREVSLRKFAQVEFDETDDFLKIPSYQQAGNLWKRLTHGAMADAFIETRPGWQNIAASALRNFPLEFYAACDLALWPPLGPNGQITIPGHIYSWQDIHPGWRFIRAVEIIANLRPTTPILGFDENSNRRFVEIQRSVCERLGWPTPIQIAQIWHSYLKLCLHAKKHAPRLLLQDDWLRLKGTLNLLHLRATTPLMASTGFLEPRNLNSLYFRVVERVSGGFNDPKITVRIFDCDQSSYRKLGYRFPPAYAVVRACNLYAEKGEEKYMSAASIGFYGASDGMGWYRSRMDETISTYAKRHYGFSVVSGRD